MNKKEFIIILTFTFIVIMIWIAAEIMHSRPSPPVNPKIKTLIDPIDPNFDAETLAKIKQFKSSQNTQELSLDSSSSLSTGSSKLTQSPTPEPTPDQSDEFGDLDSELDQL